MLKTVILLRVFVETVIVTIFQFSLEKEMLNLNAAVYVFDCNHIKVLGCKISWEKKLHFCKKYNFDFKMHFFSCL